MGNQLNCTAFKCSDLGTTRELNIEAIKKEDPNDQLSCLVSEDDNLGLNKIQNPTSIQKYNKQNNTQNDEKQNQVTQIDSPFAGHFNWIMKFGQEVDQDCVEKIDKQFQKEQKQKSKKHSGRINQLTYESEPPIYGSNRGENE